MSVEFFDSIGKAIAYSEDGDNIFFFSGEPVAFINGGSIYSFSGTHLGFFDDGWVRDHNGSCVLFTSNAEGGPVKPVMKTLPVKEVRGVMPVKGLMGVRPFRAVNQLNWSVMSGAQFFS